MSSKRLREADGDDGQEVAKRVCRSAAYDSHSVSLSFGFNQLMNWRSSKAKQSEVTMTGGSGGSDGGGKCFNCLSSGDPNMIGCHFCDRNICEECVLQCFKCNQWYCRLCAIKCYQISHENNAGVCLSCNS